MKQLSRYGLWLPWMLAAASCSAPDEGGEALGEARQTLPAGDTDYTPTSLTDVTVQQKSPYAGEGPEGLIDTASSTKLLVTRKRSWIQYRMPAPTVIRSYDITSANDAEDRDPKEWTFEGSFDGFRWVTLQTINRTAPFPQRQTTYGYTFSNTTPYLYYRLNITRNSATEGGTLQLAGLRVGGTRPSGTMPGTVGAVTATSSGTSATVTWGAVSGATGYYVQRSGEDGRSVVEFTTSGTSFVDSGLVPGGVYVYRVQAHNGGTLRGYPSGLSSVVAPAPLSGGLKDLTALTSIAPNDQYGTTGVEGIEKVTDAVTTTKYLTYAPTTWLQQQTVSGAVVTQYTLTSANDFPSRDPKDFRLQGSNSASGPWTTLDTRTGQGFPARHQTRTYSANPSNLAFSYYRLVVDANNGGAETQLAEWRLLGTASASLAAPAAPSGVTLNALSSNQILVSFTNNSAKLNPATQLTVERAPNSSFTAGQVTTKVEGAGSNEHRASSLAGGTQYCFRVKAINAAGASSASPAACATTPATTNPPTSWQETGWYGGHNRTLNRRTLGSHAALYVDQYVSPQNSGDWIAPLMDQAWGYTKTNYGSLSDPFVSIVLNMENLNPGDDYGGGGVQYASDPGAYYRNLAFSTSSNWADTSNDWILASLTHELGHLVESNTNAIFGSPTFNTWGDSKWAEVYQWDLYELLSTSLPAGFKSRAWTELNGNTDDDGIYWFRDFWYPVYAGLAGNTVSSQKGVALLSRYFQLLAQYWPHQNTRFVGDVNLGEFIHFFSGAAGVSLEAQAKVAFRWSSDLAIQFATAQRAYPGVLALYSGGSCTPETDAAFCARLGATCGTKNGADNCGTSRTVTSCGSCGSPQTCGGGGTPNVCGGGGGTNPCATLCSSPQTFSGPSYQSGNLGTGATCHETLASLAGLNCGGFASGRTFRINDTLVSCSGSNVTLPAKRNGGYCMQATAGNESWAYFSTW